MFMTSSLMLVSSRDVSLSSPSVFSTATSSALPSPAFTVLPALSSNLSFSSCSINSCTKTQCSYAFFFASREHAIVKHWFSQCIATAVIYCHILRKVPLDQRTRKKVKHNQADGFYKVRNSFSLAQRVLQYSHIRRAYSPRSSCQRSVTVSSHLFPTVSDC